MRNVEIKVFCIGQTQANDDEIRKWLDHIGAAGYEWPQKQIHKLPSIGGNIDVTGSALTGAESIIGLAAKRCYMSFEPGLNPNVTKVRKDWHDYFENILKSGHGSVMEHASYNFAIEGVSRVFTGEMNRHRAGVAISEGSMRYIRFTDIPWWIPTSLRDLPDDSEELRHKKNVTRDRFALVFETCQENYAFLMRFWDIDNPENKFHLKKVLTSCLRRIIPMGVATGGVWSMNLRAIRHIMALRTSEAAEEEIALAISQVAKVLVEKEPRLLCDFEQTAQGCWVPKYPKV